LLGTITPVSYNFYNQEMSDRCSTDQFLKKGLGDDDMTTAQLIQHYVQQRSEPAFSSLVASHISLVYSAALRQVRDPALAEDVTQLVFIVLARKAASLNPELPLDAWLLGVTRITANNALRQRARRLRHEQEAAAMAPTIVPAATSSDWDAIAPHLDDALGQLREFDRNLIVLRFMRNLPLREVGSALGLSENTTGKRIGRVLEKLRAILLRKGVTVPVSALAASLSAHGIGQAPEALAATVTHTAVLAAQTAATPGIGGLVIMATTNAKIAAIGVIALLCAVTIPLSIWAVGELNAPAPAPTSLPSSPAPGVAKTDETAREDAMAPRAAELFKNFIAEEKALAIKMAAAEGHKLRPDYVEFFEAARTGNFPVMREITRRPGSLASAPVWETYGSFAVWPLWNEKYALAYAHDILASIPPGSIYFTAVGVEANLIPALQKSIVNGDPCFTIVPWDLVFPSTRAYLRAMWSDKIYLPTEADAEQCVRDYDPHLLTAYRQNNLERELAQHIGMLLAKLIFEKNPDRQFYYQEILPTDWMYPYLEPHGLILKINRQPLPSLSDDVVKRDREFWIKYIRPLIGDWLTYDTRLKEIVAFNQRVRLEHDFSGFTGDRQFIESTVPQELFGGAQESFSRRRGAIAGVYAWRADHAADPAEKQRMIREADFAFRQTLALWPIGDCAGHYVAFLKNENRQADARLIMEMWNKSYNQLLYR